MNEKKSITDMEAILLKMWSDVGIECIYKYKNRIKAFREPLPSIELLNDVAGLFFSDIEDIANHSNSAPIDFAVRIKDILREQEQILQNEYDNHISLKYQAMQGICDDWEVREDAIYKHASNASAVYQNALLAGITLKTEWNGKENE
ncbi:hypothetical protein [Bacillus pumilus]|uniref:hypothetical protein n=1 Tax=Bacillus pumilus TaxID=1408 RepID=UPI001642CBAB|nr:hypothetical protein [Bacillus pumilus]